MNTATKITTGFVIGSALSFGVATVKADKATDDALNKKHQIAKAYLYAQARLYEPSTLDLSVISIEEASQAYAELANEKGATTEPNLMEGLYAKAVESNEACVKPDVSPSPK